MVVEDGSGTVYVADSNGNYQNNQHATIDNATGTLSRRAYEPKPVGAEIWSNIRSVNSKGAVRYGIGGA